MIYFAVSFLVFAVGLHVGYRIGHQLGFEEGVTEVAKESFLDRQDHRCELFDTCDNKEEGV